MKSNLHHNRNAQTDCKRAGNRWFRHVGFACMALGMIVGFAASMMRGDLEFSAEQQTITVLMCLGCCLIAFGVGWQCRDESDKEGVSDATN